MLPKNVLYYGREDPLPERKELRAGPLTLIYEAGELRYVKFGDRELLRGVYVAIRDRNWRTILPTFSNVQMQIGPDSFRIGYDVENKLGEIHFAWHGAISGEADGTITFTMDGVARSTFLRNRIGFCVLHPMECAGQPCRVEHVNGSIEQAAFPRYISPHQPFMDMRAISHQVIPGLWAEVRFTGDVFEMEDQRNWTDASFKTYCTPLSLPFPVELKSGTRASQSVTLTLQGKPPALQPGPPPLLTFTVGERPVGRLPHLGLGTASHGRPLTERELSRLRALHLAHLRLDLWLSQPDYPATLRQATVEARALGLPLEIALHLGEDAARELQGLVTLLGQIRPPVCTWLVFPTAGQSTSERYARLARGYLASYDARAKIGGGNDAYFTQLNRGRPPVAALDLVSYSINPQVHAFDNASLMETLPTQAATVQSARQFCGGLPLAISPITLKPRFNPAATGPIPAPRPDELPSQVDARQMSLFGAAWTAGSLKYIAESGLYSVTYYETTGWRGVMECESGSPLPEVFRSLPGAVFPLYHVLADAAEFAGSEVLPTGSSDSLCVEGLALRREGCTRIIVANLTAEPKLVTLCNVGQRVQARFLDERNAEEAMCTPEAFRAEPGEFMSTDGSALTLNLLPYAVARLDSSL